ncbi:MAG: hypothetical protein D6722_04820 [Bacteroidetes bacterium]|nr:MAG: hypothetical protein D6722_04820 [Bacteroidota bacterium]
MHRLSPLEGAYANHLLQEGRRPASVHAFMHAQDQPERAFYEQYSSFSQLEQRLMQALFAEAAEVLQGAPEYADYGTRERLLGIFFTWMEVLTAHRSLVRLLYRHQKPGLLKEGILRALRPDFQAFAQEVLRAGNASGEVADRWILPRWYADVFWTQARLVFQFWLADRSANFEQTDAIIEKSVNFLMDLIQPNALDSGVDLVRFFWQRRS